MVCHAVRIREKCKHRKSSIEYVKLTQFFFMNTLFLYEHKHAVKFSNLHQCTFNTKFLLQLLPSERSCTYTYLNIRSFDKVAKDCCNEFPKSVFWAGVEEFLIKQIISFGQQHIQKKFKKLTAKRSAFSAQGLESRIQHLHPESRNTCMP